MKRAFFWICGTLMAMALVAWAADSGRTITGTFTLKETNANTLVSASASGFTYGGSGAGSIDIYGTNGTDYLTLTVPEGIDASYTLYLPAVGGFLVLSNGNQFIGSNNVSVYEGDDTGYGGHYYWFQVTNNIVVAGDNTTVDSDFDSDTYTMTWTVNTTPGATFNISEETNDNYQTAVRIWSYPVQEGTTLSAHDVTVIWGGGNKQGVYKMDAGWGFPSNSSASMVFSNGVSGTQDSNAKVWWAVDSDTAELWVQNTSSNSTNTWKVRGFFDVATNGPLYVADEGDIQFSNIVYSVSEDGATLTVYVQRVNGDVGVASANYVTLEGTASTNSDFGYATGLLYWDDGNSDLLSYTVNITNDSTSEPTEWFTNMLFNLTNAGWGSPITVVAQITDDEANPSQVAGLKGWWAADYITGLSDDDPVTTWIDLSASGVDLENDYWTNPPTYKENIQNSLPAVLFQTNALWGSNSLVTAQAQPNWFFIVYCPFQWGGALQTIVDGVQIIGGGDPPARESIQLYNDGSPPPYTYRLYAGTGAVLNTTDTNYVTNIWYCASININGSSSHVWTNGVAIADTVSVGTQPFLPMNVGHSSAVANTFPFNGYIGEILFYSAGTNLSAADRTVVETYLMTKWGLTP